MDALDALKTRRSCRAYLDRPVDAQTLDTIIEAGRFAASGMGRQPVTFVAVTDPATVKQLSHMNAQIMGTDADPFYGAQTVVVVLVDAGVRHGQSDECRACVRGRFVLDSPCARGI